MTIVNLRIPVYNESVRGFGTTQIKDTGMLYGEFQESK